MRWIPGRPFVVRAPGGFERPFRLLAAGLRHPTDDRRLFARVETLDPAVGGDGLARDYQRPTAVEFTLDLTQRVLHGLPIGRIGKVGERLVGELGNHTAHPSMQGSYTRARR